MEESKAFQSLNLGFRELFRIFVPGFYAVALLEWLAPRAELTQFVAQGVKDTLVVSFFLGLIGIGLQVHEKWYPYTRDFERWRILLNNELGSGPDQVHRYKYILETLGEGIKNRVHYFSSFYYMLVELSLFSIAAAICLIHLFVESLRSDLGFWIWVLRILLVIALVVQLFLLSSFREVKGAISKLKFVPLILVTLWAALLVVLNWQALFTAWPYPIRKLLFLLAAAYIFSRLGAKYWKSIIMEQIIFVREKVSEIKKIPRSDA
jgi:hypothetical protein